MMNPVPIRMSQDHCVGGGRNWSRFVVVSSLLEWNHGAPVSLWLDINVPPHGGKSHEILNKDNR